MKRTTHVLWLVLFALLFFSNMQSASAQEGSVAKNKKTLLFVAGDYTPFVSETLDGLGPVPKMITAIAEGMGYKAEFKIVPWKKCEYLVQACEAFAVFPYMKTPERAKTFWNSDPFMKISTSLFFYNKQKKDFTFTGLEDLKKYKIGVIQDDWFVNFLKRNDMNIVPADNAQALIKNLRDKKFDLAILDTAQCLHVINKLYPDEAAKFGYLDKPFSEKNYGLQVAKKYENGQALVERFNAGLRQLIANKEYQKIFSEGNVQEFSIAP